MTNEVIILREILEGGKKRMSPWSLEGPSTTKYSSFDSLWCFSLFFTFYCHVSLCTTVGVSSLSFHFKVNYNCLPLLVHVISSQANSILGHIISYCGLNYCGYYSSILLYHFLIISCHYLLFKYHLGVWEKKSGPYQIFSPLSRSTATCWTWKWEWRCCQKAHPTARGRQRNLCKWERSIWGVKPILIPYYSLINKILNEAALFFSLANFLLLGSHKCRSISTQ